MVMSAPLSGVTSTVPLIVNGALPEADDPPSIESIEPNSPPARVILNL